MKLKTSSCDCRVSKCTPTEKTTSQWENAQSAKWLMPTGRFLYIRNCSPLVSHVLLLVIGCFFQLQVFIIKPCCKSFHRHHCKPHASQSISSCTTLRNRDRKDVYHTFSTESRKKQSFSSVNNHCHCIRINLLQLFWFWVSFTWVGQVMQNHAERNTHCIRITLLHLFWFWAVLHPLGQGKPCQKNMSLLHLFGFWLWL